MSEKVHARFIPMEKKNEKFEKSEPLVFIDLETSPYPLEEGYTYIILCWNSSHYVKAKADNRFEIIEQNGVDLELEKEYLILKPIT